MIVKNTEYEDLFTFSWSQDICVAESTNKHDHFERVQSYRTRAQILHGYVPHLHTHTVSCVVSVCWKGCIITKITTRMNQNVKI